MSDQKINQNTNQNQNNQNLQKDPQKMVKFGNLILQNRLRSVGSKINILAEKSVLEILAKQVADTALQVSLLDEKKIALDEQKTEYSEEEKNYLFASCYRKILQKTCQYICTQYADKTEFCSLIFGLQEIENLQQKDEALQILMIDSQEYAEIIWEATLQAYQDLCEHFWVKPDAIIKLKYNDLAYA